jgi:hypothetical protein
VITPEWAPHRQLQEDVADYLTRQGFMHRAFTYHGEKKDAYADALARINTPAAFYLRGRADSSALHPPRKLVFGWEAKTHVPGPRHDGCFEAAPLATHMDNLRSGMDCLYAYRDPDRGIECGFWVSSLPAPRCVMIPSRWDYDPDLVAYFRERFRSTFPDAEAIRLKSTRGSGDPFVVIPEVVMGGLPDWRTLVDRATVYYPPAHLFAATRPAPRPFALSVFSHLYDRM